MKKVQSGQNINWCATLYNCTTAEIETLVKDHVKKSVFQEELCPTTGRKHIQGVFSFTTRLRFNQVRDIFKDYNPHIEVCRNWDKSVEYCSKKESRCGDTICIGAARKRDQTIKDLLEKGDIKKIRDEHFGYFIRYRRTLLDDMVAQYKPTSTNHLRGVWLSGLSGTGKTKYISTLESTYFKGTNKWWDGYMGERIIILDDVDAKIWTWGIHYIKRWTDHYPVVGEIKGSHANLNHEWFIVTSNVELDISLREVDYNHSVAIKRRFIEFSTNMPNWEDMMNLTVKAPSAQTN